MDTLQKSAKRYAISFTIIYSILFIPLLFMGLLSGMVFDKPGISSTYGFTIIFLALCVPFSIPFSMYLIWSRYRRGEYKNARRFYFLPVLIFITVIVLIENIL